ncbi:hypothetical protein Goklo_025092, partial [Gossypium klotzschianum]|nr:hypothetical protein [Gossypium klotzschianum]
MGCHLPIPMQLSAFQHN